jgi:hypothetical protein
VNRSRKDLPCPGSGAASPPRGGSATQLRITWLRDTIPGATDVVEIDGARLFFPGERATELTAALHRHWDSHP